MSQLPVARVRSSRRCARVPPPSSSAACVDHAPGSPCRATRPRSSTTIPLASDHREFVVLPALARDRHRRAVRSGAGSLGATPVACTDADVIGTMCTGAAVGHEDTADPELGGRSRRPRSIPVDSYASLLQREGAALGCPGPRQSAGRARRRRRTTPATSRFATRTSTSRSCDSSSSPGTDSTGRSSTSSPGSPPYRSRSDSIRRSSSCTPRTRRRPCVSAVLHELAGVYNVASEGQIRWSHGRARRSVGSEMPGPSARRLRPRASARSLRRPASDRTTSSALARFRAGRRHRTRSSMPGSGPSTTSRTCVQTIRTSSAETRSGWQIDWTRRLTRRAGRSRQPWR